MLDHAPIDDELETEEERHAIAEVHADRARHQTGTAGSRPGRVRPLMPTTDDVRRLKRQRRCYTKIASGSN